MKNKDKTLLITLFEKDKEALIKAAEKNKRPVKLQAEWYILQGLKQENK